MFSGMTGFGTVQVEEEWGTVRVEVRSWNGKGLDISIRGPFLLPEWEYVLRQEIKAFGIYRGTIRVDLFVQVRNAEYEVVVNKGLMSSLLEGLSEYPQLNEKFSIYDAVKIPGLVQYYLKDPSRITPSLLGAVRQAVKSLMDMRKKEGREIFQLVQFLVKESADLSRKIEERVHDLDKAGFFDIREETSSFRKDVHEEVKRLKMNIKIFRNKMREKGPKGKAMDFIAQEILREANTFLAKIVDAELSGYALALKLRADRIREVVQNVE